MRQSQKKFLKFLLFLFLVVGGFLFVQTAFAQEFGINEIGKEIALPAEDPRIVAARIIRAALGFLGIIALIIVLYGGFVWMTSGGNEEKITKAKKILTNGLIGLIIIVMAFGIVQFVLNRLMEVTGIARPGAPSGGPPVVDRLSGSLGNSIIESHYPPRGGTGIPRNTKIIVTFKEKMLLESFINNYNDNDTPQNLTDDTVVKNNNGTKEPDDDWMELKAENIKIYKSIDGERAALAANQVKVTFTPDLKTFVFDPVDFLGSPSENIWYTTALKPDLKKADGTVAFVGAFRDGYAWEFEVSTFVDTTPPQVESVVPREGSTNPRNVIIQINFDEAMDPTTVSGEWPSVFKFIEVKKSDGTTPIEGIWQIGNQYKTVEFTTNEECGTNSCGGKVYCLPANERPVNVLLLAATLSKSPPEALMPPDGVTDVAGNSLDGDKDRTAEGQPNDNFGLSFNTTDTIDLTPPQIETVVPSPGQGNVEFNAPVEMRFSKLMSISSFNSENIILEDNQRDECAVWFTLGGTNLKSDNTPVTTLGDTPVKTKAEIFHGNFIPSDGVCSDGALVSPEPVIYFPRVTHKVKDLFQNCFFEPVGPTGGTQRKTLPFPQEPWE